MISSMTGFGRHEEKTDSFKVTVELKSVNHRYLDLNIKMPVRIGYLENNVRSVLQERLIRGKVDVYISYEETADKNYSVTYHSDVATGYLKAFEAMAKEFSLENDIRVSHLSRFPDVITTEEVPSSAEEVWERISPVLDAALTDFIASRKTEGERLQSDLLQKLKQMEAYVSIIEEKSPALITDYKKRLTEKVEEMLSSKDIDESRIAQEVTVYADKICIDEELVRLKSHVAEASSMIATGDEVGRKLDFIAQEMNREANTILSKSTDVSIADLGIELKTLIEKIREQIQNLE